MKLKFDFEVMEMDDEMVAVPVGDGSEDFHGVLKLNDSAAFLLEQLKEDVTEDQLVERVLAQYEGDKDEIRAFVKEYVASLSAEDLLA